MTIEPPVLAQLIRGDAVESRHRGHIVVCDAKGNIRESWGDPDAEIYPRSSCKMLQALPLIESGAADRFGLTDAHLALACASHTGSPEHTRRVEGWLADLGLSETDLRCGPQPPESSADRDALRKAGQPLCQLHNNCSGKHAGFLTLGKHLGAGPEYIDIAHPVQAAVKQAFEEMTEATSPGFGIDGCSAPNHRTSLKSFAMSLAKMAAPVGLDQTRQDAALRLVTAMMTHPLLVAGENRACTEIMRAAPGKVAIKTGAEAVFAAILPEQKLGIALKIEDGATRASNAVIAALMVRYGILDALDPVLTRHAHADLPSRRGLPAARLDAVPSLFRT